MRMVTVTPRAVAWAVMASIWVLLPSTRATQVRRWCRSRRSVSSNIVATTARMSSVTSACNHFPVTAGPGRRVFLRFRVPCRVVVRAAMTSSTVRGSGGQVVDRDDLGQPFAAVLLTR